MRKETNNSVLLSEAIVEAMRAQGMTCQRVRMQGEIDEDSAVEHTIDLDVVHKQVLFNVRIEAILFAGHVEPIKKGA